jgi:outer membrane immunogenic protein
MTILGEVIMKSLLIVCTSLTALSSIATAADLPPKKFVSIAPLPFTWTGFYIGGQLGMSIFNVELTLNNGTSYEKNNPSKLGLIGGVQAGYLYQFSNNIVFGAEFSYAWTQTNASKTVSLGITELRTRSVTAEDLFIVALRAGYALNDWLPYLKVGYANSGNELTTFDVLRVQPTIIPSDARSSGWVVGAGIDYALRQNVLLGIEYNYSYFNVGRRPTIAAKYPSIWYASGGEVNMNYGLQTLMARVSYKF